MKVAAAYIRVSTDDQIEFSPDSQLEKIKLYAERNQILLPKEFIFMDEGISGRNTKKRTAFPTFSPVNRAAGKFPRRFVKFYSTAKMRK